MMTTEEQKIERSFTESVIEPKAKTLIIKKSKSNKIETKIDESIISINQADNMNTETETMNAQATAFVVEAKKKNPTKPRTKKLVIDEGANTIATIPPPEPEIAPVVEAVEEDEEAELLSRLAEIKKQKAQKEARTNIVEHRKNYAGKVEEQRQEILAKIQALNAEQLALQHKFADIHEGRLDDEIITKLFTKKTAVVKLNADGEVVKKSAGVAGEGENRARAVRKLNDDDAKEKKMLSAFTKRVGEYRWGLHRGGTITAKDKQGVYSMPLWKEQNATMVVEGENSFKTIKEFKEWILENNK